MSLISDLLEKPATLSAASKYTVLNGYIYLGAGLTFIFWPGAVQTLFMDAPFAGKEEALFRVIGLTVAVIGWFYLFRRPFRRAAIRCRECARSLGARSGGARAAGHRRRFSSYVPGVCASRRLSRHWRLDAPRSHNLISASSRLHRLRTSSHFSPWLTKVLE